jgi:1-acyl-sn-glycerol-3-phosphate acyltransferase
MVRSIVFGILFYITTALFVVFGFPFFFTPRSWSMAALKVHARTELWLLKHIVGLDFEVRGLERLGRHSRSSPYFATRRS